MVTSRDLFDALCTCVLRHDDDGFASLCTDDVVMELPFSRVRFCGRADVRDGAALAWRAGRRRLVAFQFVRISDAGEMLVAEFDVVGYVGDRPFRGGAVLLLETRGGKIAGLRAYVDPRAGVRGCLDGS